jgi:hypothetical protein
LDSYVMGVDEEILGASSAGRKGGPLVGAALGSGRSVLITVRDVPALIRAQGGNAGALIDRFVPDTLESTVYSKMAAKIASGMKDEGVDADVRVVAPTGYKPAPTPDFFRGVLVGAGSVGAGWLVWKLIRGLFS